MFLMRADPLRGEVGGAWSLEIASFLGPVIWHRADRRVPFGAQKTRDFQGPTQVLLLVILCTGAFLDARYSLLLIFNQVG
jgi:hypothetical protein